MATTKQKEKGFAGFFEKTREYLVEKTALFGAFRWEEVVHTEKVDDDLIMRVWTTKIPTKTYINGKEYKLVEVTS